MLGRAHFGSSPLDVRKTTELQKTAMYYGAKIETLLAHWC